MAHGNSAVLMVRAEVRPSAALKFEAKTSEFAITEADLAQGYLEIPADALLRLTAGKFQPLLFLDSMPLRREGASYRFDLGDNDKLAPTRRVVLRVEL